MRSIANVNEPSANFNDAGLRPFVTVLMPVRNEEDVIAESLGAVLAQDYPKDRIEIFVIDGMSTDRTKDIVESLQQSHPSLRVFDNEHHSTRHALNIGIRRALGDIIVRVDGHTIIARDYVRQCVAALDESGADNVGGAMRAVSEGWQGRAIALATSSPFGEGSARFHYSEKDEYVDTVYLGAWRREAFEQYGLFDEDQVCNEDDEFNYRMREHGGTIFLSSRIRSRYFNRGTILKLFRQYFRYGYWKVPVMQKHPRQMRLCQFVPPIFVLALLITGLPALFYSIHAYLFSLIVGVYLVATLCASIWLCQRASWRHFPILPVVFATLHISYGLGFVLGLLRFAHRWRLGPYPQSAPATPSTQI